MRFEFTPEGVELGYRNGIFPMAGYSGDIRWHLPDPRAIFPLESFHVPRRLARVIAQQSFEVRINTAFTEVMRACATQPRGGSWISEEFIELYTELHRRGKAHSVESWREDRLVGGLYGVSFGGAFMGESMFHVETDASKVALVALVERLRERGFVLLDTQWNTSHLQRFGAVDIPAIEYARRLQSALQLDCRFDL